VNREGRPEAAFVLLLIQGTTWMLAGLSALVFGVAGERGMLLLGVLTILLGASAGWLGVALLLHLKRARRLTLTLEWICLVGSLIQWVLPLGNRPGPVALLTGFVLPAALLWLLHGRRAKLELASAP
jgi:hypothetical protein